MNRSIKQAMLAEHIYTVAGTGNSGFSGEGASYVAVTSSMTTGSIRPPRLPPWKSSLPTSSSFRTCSRRTSP